MNYDFTRPAGHAAWSSWQRGQIYEYYIQFHLPVLGGRGRDGAYQQGRISHGLKPLVPVLFLAVVVMYGLADRLRNFVIGLFVPQYHFHYPVVLCFGQVLVSLLLLNLLHVLGLAPLKRYSRSLGETLLLPAICSSIQDVMVMWLKASSLHGGLFLLALPLLPLMTAAFSFALKMTSTPTVHISVMVSILSGTSIVITASKGLSHIEPLECLYTPLALILHGLALTFLGKASDMESRQPPDAQVSTFDIYYTTLVNQGLVLGVLWLLHPDGLWRVWSQGSWNSLLFNGYLHAILLLGTLLNSLLGISALSVSPFAAAVLHSTKQLLQPFNLLL